MDVARPATSIVAISVMSLFAGPALGQSYPAKPVRILANGPGGGVDFVARLVAQGIAAPLGQSVIVDNRGGALIVAELAAKAPPDGYTLYATSGVMWLAPFMQNVSYDPVKDFSPLSLATKVTNVLVVHPSLPVRTVKDLIALARAKPGELNYASAGTGGSPHLAAELFKSMAGVNILRVAYKSAAPALTDLMAGQVHLMFATGGPVGAHLNAGRLRGLAVTSQQPSVLFPSLPTLASSGLPGYESETIYGIFVPAKTPTALLNRLNHEIVRYLGDADVKARLLKAGIEAVGSSPEEFAAVIKADLARMGKVIRDAGIKGE